MVRIEKHLRVKKHKKLGRQVVTQGQLGNCLGAYWVNKIQLKSLMMIAIDVKDLPRERNEWNKRIYVNLFLTVEIISKHTARSFWFWYWSLQIVLFLIRKIIINNFCCSDAYDTFQRTCFCLRRTKMPLIAPFAKQNFYFILIWKEQETCIVLSNASCACTEFSHRQSSCGRSNHVVNLLE